MVVVAEGASRFAMRDVLVMGASLDASGLRVVTLAVGDEADDGPPLAPDDEPSPATVAAFDEWAALGGASTALPNLLVPDAPRLAVASGDEALFAGAPVDRASRRYLTASPDARALRIRARILHWLAMREVVDATGTVHWASLGAAPSIPVASAVADAGRAGATVEATFIDASADAVRASRRGALAHGLDPAAHRFFTRAEAIELEPLAPASQDLVEALALLEGRTLEEAAASLARAFDLVRPGGSLVFSATVAGRPEPDAGLAWPAGSECRIDEIASLVDAAGIPVLDAMVHLAQDGVYAVVEVTRP